MIDIKCGSCGQRSPFEEWEKAPVAGDLPKHEFQCPKCRVAIRRKVGPGRITPWGQEIPGDISIHRIQPYL